MSEHSKKSDYQFAISLSVLNHLGRSLYRNFITVLGEAISNSWDADANNVWIYIDRENSEFSIIDDGHGMNGDDFQNKFLKIGYSKRADGETKTKKERPFIGAKGIGKLALLSCADRVSIFSKKSGEEYIGGVIDNSGLDDAIKDDLLPNEYPLEGLNFELIEELSQNHSNGTIIVFEGMNDNLRNSVSHLKKLLAMSFRFSLIDPDFSIFVNDEEVGIDDLADMRTSTEFLWLINGFYDDYIGALNDLKNDSIPLTTIINLSGFLATVEKPRHLKVSGTEERATVDLFVNGRLREKNILRHIPTQRIIESYIYGQIHFDEMDAGVEEPFTSSREGVVENDQNFRLMLNYLKTLAMPHVMDQWDKLRLDRGKEGDDENPRKTTKQRKARDLFAAVKSEYEPDNGDPNKDQVDEWLSELRPDAEYNFSAYADCFLSENLVRKYIKFANSPMPKGVKSEADEWRDQEVKRKGEANISFEIRQSDEDVDYLGMNPLAVTAEGGKDVSKGQTLWLDALSYRPVRNVIGHTGLLTEAGKVHLSLKYENIKARVKTLLSS